MLVAGSPVLIAPAADRRLPRTVCASQIHKAIRDEDFDLLPQLLKEASRASLWHCNSRGWSALHFAACAHSQSTRWWKWILDKSACRESDCDQDDVADKLLRTRTDMGHTVFDLFLRHSLQPLPWQHPAIKRRAKSLEHKMKLAVDSADSLACIREQVGRLEADDCGQIFELETHSDGHDDPVHDVSRFLWHFILLNRAAGARDRKDMWFFMAETEWCPEVVAELVYRLFPESLTPAPLLIWARSEPSYRTHDHGVPAVILRVLPDSASSGALHAALLAGRSWRSVRALVRCSALCEPDAATGLPAFVLPALRGPSARRVQIAATVAVGLWCYLPQTLRNARLKNARDALELERLDTIYQALRNDPGAMRIGIAER